MSFFLSERNQNPPKCTRMYIENSDKRCEIMNESKGIVQCERTKRDKKPEAMCRLLSSEERTADSAIMESEDCRVGGSIVPDVFDDPCRGRRFEVDNAARRRSVALHGPGAQLAPGPSAASAARSRTRKTAIRTWKTFVRRAPAIT